MALELKYELKDFNKGKIIDKYEMQKGGDTQLFFANTCFKRMTKYVPWRTGNLATTVTVKAGSVTYEMKYAHRQYVGNKGKGIRGKQWDKRMVNGEKSAIVKEVEAYAKKMKGNK